MQKIDFFVEMDSTLKNGVHTPGNLPPAFDWKFFDSTPDIVGGGTKGRLDHTYYLFHYASVLPDNNLIIKIGTGNIESLIALGMGIRGKNSKIINIDPGFMPMEEMSKRSKEIFSSEIEIGNLDKIADVIKKSGLEKYITIIGDTSDKVYNRWDGNLIDLLYIECSHKYERIKADCQWLKYVKPGGVAVFDNWIDSAKKTVHEYIADKPEWELLTESVAQLPGHPWKTVYWKNERK